MHLGGLTDVHPADELGELARGELVGRQGDGGAPVVGQPRNMRVHQRHNRCVETDRVRRTARRSTFGNSFDERIFGELAVLVVLVGRAEPLDSSRHPVAVAVAATCQPHSAAEILADDFAVRSDPQRRSTGHGP